MRGQCPARPLRLEGLFIFPAARGRPKKCTRAKANGSDMTASMSKGNGHKRSQHPLWRRKANYVLRELVRAWHGLPHDTGVIWGFRFAVDDIIHTFAKENCLNFPKLCFWFNQAWREVAECFGRRAFTTQDWQKFQAILHQVAPLNGQWIGEELLRDEGFMEVLFLASRLYLREDGYLAKEYGDYRLRHSLAHYEGLEVAPLDSFTIWYVKRVYGGTTEI